MKPKNIVMDAGGLIDISTDVGFYTYGILNEILTRETPYNVIATIFSDEKDHPLPLKDDRLHYVTLSDKRDRAMGAFKAIDKTIQVDHVDLMVHFSGLAVPQIKKVDRRALVVHELGFKDRPDLYTHVDRGKLEKDLSKSLKNADVIIATSNFTAGRVRELYGTSKPVEVATPAIDPSVFNHNKLESDAYLSVKHQLPQHFVLYYGAIDSRSHVVALVDAYMALPQSFKDVFGIVIAGKADTQLVNSLKIKLPSLVVLESLAAEDVAPLMRLATLFVSLSHYDGFAFNALQAMACGLPVIISSADGLKEVVDGAGMVTSNNSPEQAVRALQGLLSDSNLRAEYTARGLDRAMYYNWQNSADTILSVIGRPK